MSYGECSALAQDLNITSSVQWRQYWKGHDRPANVPANPNAFYKHGSWISWSHFLGRSEEVAVVPYEECSVLAQQLGITSSSQWRQFWKRNERPANIPFYPELTYKWRGWLSWIHFLGRQG